MANARVIDLEEARASRIAAALGPARYAGAAVDKITGLITVEGGKLSPDAAIALGRTLQLLGEQAKREGAR